MKRIGWVAWVAFVAGSCQFTLAATTMPESTKLNTFFNGILSGGYVGETMSDWVEDIPLLNILPIEMFSLEDEVSHFIERESSRYARNLVREKIGELGLSGPLSLTSSGVSVGGGSRASSRSRRATSIQTRLSSHRVGLSFILRF